MPVANFAPQMLELFRQASASPVEVPLRDYKQAVRFRFRMYQLRKEMRKEQHPLLPIAEQVQIKLLDNIALCCPVDNQFADALKGAGIEAPDETPTDFEIPEVTSEEDSAMNAALHRVFDDKSET
ncbi:MAG: hypothetical protein GTO00_09215 [Deltaproteobacteria bacterium]|nr:hypothetical protein [Deltaproteobacteria bacterium]